MTLRKRTNDSALHVKHKSSFPQTSTDFAFDKLLYANTVYWRTPANRSSEQEKIMTNKPQAKNAGRTDTKKIASKKPKEKVAALKNTQNEVATCELVPNHAQLMLEDLEPAHQKEFKDALEIASIVLSGKSIEAALMQVRENVKVVFKNQTEAASINIAMNQKFEPHYGKEHLENIDFTFA